MRAGSHFCAIISIKEMKEEHFFKCHFESITTFSAQPCMRNWKTRDRNHMETPSVVGQHCRKGANLQTDTYKHPHCTEKMVNRRKSQHRIWQQEKKNQEFKKMKSWLLVFKARNSTTIPSYSKATLNTFVYTFIYSKFYLPP